MRKYPIDRPIIVGVLTTQPPSASIPKSSSASDIIYLHYKRFYMNLKNSTPMFFVVKKKKNSEKDFSGHRYTAEVYIQRNYIFTRALQIYW